MIFVLLQSAFAEETPTAAELPLDRATFVARVLELNPDVATASYEAEAARARGDAAGRWAEPTVGASIAPLSVGGGPPSTGYAVSVSQELPLSGRTNAERDASARQVAVSVATAEQSRLDVAVAASLAFTDWRMLHDADGIVAEQSRLLDEFSNAARAAYESTDAGLGTVLGVEVERVAVEEQRLTVEERIATVRADMNALLHAPQDAVVPAPAPAPPPPPVAPFAGEPASTPEVIGAAAAASAAEAELLTARRANVPDPTVLASYETMWMDVEHRLMIGLAMDLPIQPGRRRALVDEAEADLAAARAHADAEVDAADAHRTAAGASYAAATARLTLQLERGIPLAEQRLAAERAAFEGGSGGVIELLDAARTLLDTRLAAVDARADLERAWVAVQRTTGNVDALLSSDGAP